MSGAQVEASVAIDDICRGMGEAGGGQGVDPAQGGKGQEEAYGCGGGGAGGMEAGSRSRRV